jgi:hypothetical protein
MISIFSEIVESMPSAAARLICISILQKHAGATLHIPVDNKRGLRIQAAANMIRNGSQSAGEIVAALRVRYRISDATSWRYLKLARQLIERNDSK